MLLSAAVLAAGVATSMAANVYSVNVVGYVTVPIGSGYNLIANPLDVDGVDNIETILPTVPDGTQLFQWTPSIANFAPLVQYYAAAPGWFDQSFNPATNNLAPGLGFYLYNPGSATTVTFVGNVVQGTNTQNVNGGYGFYGIIPAIASDLDTNGFPAQDGMQYETFNNSINNFTPLVQYYSAGLGWYDQSFTQVFPTPNVGQGFLVYNPLATSYTWTTIYSVQ
jgi:hypothetical protein